MIKTRSSSNCGQIVANVLRRYKRDFALVEVVISLASSVVMMPKRKNAQQKCGVGKTAGNTISGGIADKIDVVSTVVLR